MSKSQFSLQIGDWFSAAFFCCCHFPCLYWERRWRDPAP